MDFIKPAEIIRYQGGEARRIMDQVLREYEFELILNGVTVERGSCIEAHLEAMAQGFLLTEGLIARPEQIKAVRLSPGHIEVEAAGGPGAPAEERRLSPPAWNPEEVIEAAGQFLLHSHLFQTTGSVHSALLAVDGGSYTCEDLGRHNAIDKVVGLAMADEADLAQAILYTSGRLPVGMARKAVRAGVPVVVSRSAPTDLTLALAQQTGLTVIGFAREGRMNLYSGSAAMRGTQKTPGQMEKVRR